jgi:hypothetical protein
MAYLERELRGDFAAVRRSESASEARRGRITGKWEVTRFWVREELATNHREPVSTTRVFVDDLKTDALVQRVCPYPKGDSLRKEDMDTPRDMKASGPFEARYLAFLETITQLRPRLHRYCRA